MTATSPRRLPDIVAALGLGVLCALAFLWDAMLVRTMVGVRMNDFGRFYYSARAFLDGKDMYAPGPATELGGGLIPGAQELLNLNPPHFHLLILPLARLTPDLAVSLWLIAGIFALILSLLVIAREIGFVPTPARVLTIVLFALLCAPSQAVLITGQLGFLLLLPVTLCWRDARHGKWNRVGLWLGPLLSVKLFFLILIPWLVRNRRWRACAMAAATMAACFAAGLLIFGAPNYLSWMRALTEAGDWAWLGMNASVLGTFQRIFRTTPAFAPLAIAPALVGGWIVVAGAIAAASFVAVFADNTCGAVDRAFACLLIAAQLLSPVGWVYYLWLPAGPIAALAWGAGRTGWPSSIGRYAALGGLAGLLVPVTAPYVFQPDPWATLILGSIYCWSALALWVAALR